MTFLEYESQNLRASKSIWGPISNIGKKIQYSCPVVKSWYLKRQTPTLWLENDVWQKCCWHQFSKMIVVKLCFSLTYYITELLVVNHSIRVFVQLKRNMINISSLWSLQPSISYNPSSHHYAKLLVKAKKNFRKYEIARSNKLLPIICSTRFISFVWRIERVQ